MQIKSHYWQLGIIVCHFQYWQVMLESHTRGCSSFIYILNWQDDVLWNVMVASWSQHTQGQRNICVCAELIIRVVGFSKGSKVEVVADFLDVLVFLSDTSMNDNDTFTNLIKPCF